MGSIVATAVQLRSAPKLPVISLDPTPQTRNRLPETHLVMHGSSPVLQELLDIINACDGEMPQTYGVPVDEIVEGIRHGVRKVNIDTDCRMAITPQVAHGIPARQLAELAGDG